MICPKCLGNECSDTLDARWVRCPLCGLVKSGRSHGYTDEEARVGWLRKEDALDGHEERKGDRLEEVREAMRHLSRRQGEVNADDARAYCDAHGIERGPWMGSIFRGREWRHVGWANSRDPVQNSRGIRVWRLA